MFKTAKELKVVDREGFKGGLGRTQAIEILSPDELCSAGRLFSVTIMPPGSSIGYHHHEGEFEVYYILSGEADVTIDGETRRLYAGDMTCCQDGSSHGISNPGAEDLRYIAAILYTH